MRLWRGTVAFELMFENRSPPQSTIQFTSIDFGPVFWIIRIDLVRCLSYRSHLQLIKVSPYARWWQTSIRYLCAWNNTENAERRYQLTLSPHLLRLTRGWHIRTQSVGGLTWGGVTTRYWIWGNYDREKWLASLGTILCNCTNPTFELQPTDGI